VHERRAKLLTAGGQDTCHDAGAKPGLRVCSTRGNEGVWHLGVIEYIQVGQGAELAIQGLVAREKALDVLAARPAPARPRRTAKVQGV
jgi:hypothetical protein